MMLSKWSLAILGVAAVVAGGVVFANRAEAGSSTSATSEKFHTHKTAYVYDHEGGTLINTVEWDGSGHYAFNWDKSRPTGVFFFRKNYDNVRGVDPNGNTYVVQDTDTIHWVQFTDLTKDVTQTFVENIRLRGQGKAPNYRGYETTTYVFHADGTVDMTEEGSELYIGEN